MRALALLLALALLAPPIAAAQQGGRGFGSGKGGQQSGGGSRGGRGADTEKRESNKPRIPQDEGPEFVGKYSLNRNAVVRIVDDGDGRPALEAYEKAAIEAERDGALVLAVRAGASAVMVASRLNLTQKVLTLGPRVIDLGKKAPPQREVARAVIGTAGLLARTYRSVNDVPKALAVLDDAATYARLPAIAAQKRTLTGVLASVLETRALIEAAQGDRAGALVHLREAVQLTEDMLSERMHERRKQHMRRNVALAYLRIAHVALTDRQLDVAASALARAAEMARRVGLAEITADVALQSANLSMARGNAAEALRFATDGRAEAERASLEGKIAEADRLIATANSRLGHPEAALEAAQRSLARIEGTRAALEDPAQRAGFLDQRQSLYSLAVHQALRLKKPEEAFALAERGRSRAFLDLLGSAALSKGRTQALAQEEAALRARLAEAASADHESDADADTDESTPPSAPGARVARERTVDVERDYKAFLQRVRKENGEQASLMAVEPVTVAEIQALLPEGTALVEYLLSGGDLIIWVLDRASVHVRTPKLERNAFVTEVREFRAALASQAPLADVDARARAIYQKVLGPVRPLLRDKRLVLVPHDVLHYLPFAALRTPDGKWLMEEHTLSTVPSASVLKFLTDKGAQANSRILAIGNPDLGPALALRYAEREVQAIRERFPSETTILTRADATESRVKRDARAAGLLHFAVHGELSETDPMASALLLAPGGGEDGRLEVRELFATDLSARLVVLSACETGLGKLSRGDELVGLQRAFLYAGTPAVVTTLWKVDDRASFMLMRAFYDGLAAKSPAEALRAAQRALIVDFPHPFAWAGFGLTGAPR